MNPSSNNLGLNTVVPTLVQNPSTRSPSTAATTVSNIQNSSSPINLFTNFSSGLLPSNTSNTSISGQGQSASSRLKVEDALSYLDKVKNQFALQPQVYNQFLDIMKEFKSQSIDTQEVINRVSTLFHGHPDLIVGFNTFLPPGYKIEVSNDHHGYIQVTHPTLGTESIAIGGPSSTYNLAITTPTSTTYHSSTIRQTSNLLNQDNDEAQQVKNETPQPSINPTTHAVNTLISAASAPQLPCFGTTGGFNLSIKTNKQPTLNTTTTTTTAAAAAATINNNNNNNSTNASGQPVEFNHAINYVNKIKNRFHQNPNVYKTFLEILHTYQKQQKDAKESPTISSTTNNEGNNQGIFLSETEVYAKVAQLFTNHEDLLSEFSQFLPDATQQPIERLNSLSDILSSSDNSNSSITPVVSNSTPRLIISNTVASSIITPSASLTTTSSIPSQTISISTANKDELSSPKRSTIITASMNNNKRPVSSLKPQGISKKKRISLTNNIPITSSTIDDIKIQDTTGQNKNLPSIDEISFFDKVQKTLRSPLVFDNFLRCILLYTKRIITRIELFELIQSYLGHVPELLKTFQELISLRGPGEVIIPKSIYDQNDTDSMISIDYGSCSQQGTSYRSVPRSYIPPACSGRTLLCKEVLNDHCVLFPTFTDESSSVAAKKSVFEEHMYKIEDERFELDIVMEVNLSAIRSLESVQLHMNSLTPEQLNNFQLDDQLGGQSTFTQRQAVQRIYGERASEIIDGLKRNPRVAVPIVLKRLKSKDEEWRESKKNFERFWKEQSEKYYLKSLDYMGINCKNSDGRIIRNRHLLNEIENIKEERDQQLTPNNNQPHLIYSYEDLSILDDAASLIIFLVKRQMTFAKEDKQNIKKIMYQFLPDFLFAPRGELSDDEEDDDDDENENNGKRDKKSRPTRHTDANRRRNTDFSATKRRQVTQEYQKPDDMFHLFFVNDNYYYFFRLHQLLYERLLKMFQQSLRLIEEDDGSQRNRPLSIASVLRTSNRPNITVDEYYSVFLDMVRHLLDGNMDSLTYEDSLREMFGIHAYIAFTMDKIIQNCVRQLHAIVTDESSDTIMRLYSQTNGTAGCVDNLYSTAQQNAEAIYQREMETYANGNRLFRVCSFKNDRRITTSLIVIDSSDDEDEERICENGASYVESYLHKNEGDHDEAVTAHLRTKLRKKPRFLHRNILITNDPSTPEIVTINNDYCRIDAKTHKRKPFHCAGFFLYRRNSLRLTKQNHKKLTLEQYNRFKQYHDDWSLKNISENDSNNSINNLWLKTHRLNTNNDQQPLVIQPIVSNNEHDLVQPPYHHYQQYHIADIEK
ncbi:unnamed protein product [Rotaria magnacalcarata]|uniref:Paired amphipathic helix protein Sin3b n=5 Tax=Rotaria magnacalcarata TaxID=392030 RepID=A0A814WP77_9BILA|nr:unnamed protein product [Rotaria magnacalcarata]CAF1208305.1 unnamed protein product [Rotaria magnacalcarata]CAF1920020.1 unnamed protein product [Rotaria magnacalcarata]